MLEGEREIEEFLVRIVPGFEQQCTGATVEEIQRLEEIAGRPLPNFYRWLLGKVGRDLGPLGPILDGFLVRDVIDEHENEGETPPGLFLIGTSQDEVMPMAHYYDLDAAVRGDALVLEGPLFDTEAEETFETLRELVAWSAARMFRVEAAKHRCIGKFRDEEKEVSSKLVELLASLGFTCPVPTGPYCKILESEEMMLACMAPPKDRNRGLLFFDLGGPAPGALRRILGEIADKAPIRVEVDRWETAD